MCTCNGAKYIVEQLESIINQTYPIYELIIQDDCSTDDTWKIILEYNKKYSYIKCFSNTIRKDVNPNFKDAFFHATGDIIAPSDQDDIWVFNKIEKLINLIGDNDLAYSKSTVLYEDNTTLTSNFPNCSYFEQCLWNNPVAGHTCIFKSSMLTELKKCIDLPIPYDHCICLIAYSNKSWIKTDLELQFWRKHSTSITEIGYKSYTLHNLQKHHKLYKFAFTFMNLLKVNKAIGVKERFDSISEFYIRINADKGLIKLSKYLSKQTLLSYLFSGFICLFYKDKMFPINKQLNSLQKLSRISFVLRYPMTYWFDNHLVRYL
ncbi:MAG TPA: glycosyltransferase [Candidatus Paceibacterota bacterium]